MGSVSLEAYSNLKVTNNRCWSEFDGVGTKLKIAEALNKHDTVGIDIVNHSVNYLFTTGADPLFFLDYIAMGKLVPETVEAIAHGLSSACREVNCVLIGG